MDADIRLMATQFNLDLPHEKLVEITQAAADLLIAQGKKGEMVEILIEKFNGARKQGDFILCEGTDFISSNSGVEPDINATLIKNLACPVLPVANAF